MKWNCCSQGLFAVLIASLTGVARAQISSYGVTKTGYYTQSSDTVPVLEAGDNHYFEAFVNPDGTVDIDSAILQVPSGSQIPLSVSAVVLTTNPVLGKSSLRIVPSP